MKHFICCSFKDLLTSISTVDASSVPLNPLSFTHKSLMPTGWVQDLVPNLFITKIFFNYLLPSSFFYVYRDYKF